MTCPTCENLRDELTRLKEVASVDIQNLQTRIVMLERDKTRLKNELAKSNESDPDAGPVKNVLLHWKAQTGKSTRTDIRPDGKRWKLTKAAVSRWGEDRCKTAITGLAAHPFAGPRGRSAEEYPGSKRFDDIEHALGDEVRFERCEELATAAELTVEERRTLENVKKFSGEIARREQRHERRPKPQPPILLFLDKLRMAGADPRPSGVDKWVCSCPHPEHPDRNPSFYCTVNSVGDVWFDCPRCDKDAIMRVLGLEYSELFATVFVDSRDVDGQLFGMQDRRAA